MIIDLSREVAGHLAVAVRLYRQRADHDGLGVPAALRDIECEMAARAMRGQQGTPLADPWEARNAEPMNVKVLTYEQAAARLQCSQRTIKRRVAAGDLVPVRSGRVTRLLVADVDNAQHLYAMARTVGNSDSPDARLVGQSLDPVAAHHDRKAADVAVANAHAPLPPSRARRSTLSPIRSRTKTANCDPREALSRARDLIAETDTKRQAARDAQDREGRARARLRVGAYHRRERHPGYISPRE